MTSGREFARALRTAYLALHRQTNACFATDGVTADQFVVLSALADKDRVTQQDLACRVNSDPNSVRPILVLLEGRGLIARGPQPADGRTRCVALTAKGRHVFKTLWANCEPLRARLLGAFRPGEVTTLVELLHRVADVLSPAASAGRRTAG
jgi:DNA-binding MarR family transcriptional regulator